MADEPKKGQWGGRREGGGRPIGSMAGLAPLLVRTLRALPDGAGIEVLEELRGAIVRLSEAGPRRRAMAKAMIAALRQATP